MSNITSNTLAAAKAVGIKNQQFKPGAKVLPRKMIIIGTGDPTTEAANDLNTPILATSAEYIGSLTGFGFMLHRLAKQAFLGSNGIETYFIQQPENVAAVQATGDIDFAGTTGVLAGTLAIYIAGIRVPVTITDAMTIENITDACVAAITANDDLPVTAAKRAVTFELDITAKSGGPWGNDITIEVNLLSTDVTPTGITLVITDMASGAGLPDIQDALDSLGTGDASNEDYFTAIIHGYGQDTTTLNAISTYNGPGNDFTGNYDKVVGRPFRSLVGDTATGAAGLAALVVIGDGRKQDRTSGIIAVPNSPNHPGEIAALAMGLMEKISNNRPEKMYVDLILSGILPGATTDRWTNEHTNRDTAVKAGISPTFVKSGYVTLQNVVTFYHPDDVPVTSNGYREMRNIAITQNILYNWKLLFSGDAWKSKTIVSDVNRVSIPSARLNAVDIDTYRSFVVTILVSFEQNAWIYNADFSIEALKEAGAISVRAGGDGFNSDTKLIYSGMANIYNTDIYFDISLASFL